MASIGDLYFTFRGDGARLTADAKKEGAKAGDVAGKGFVAKMKASLKGGFGGGIAQGLGIGAALGGVSLLTSATGALTDAIGASIDAASDQREAMSLGKQVFEENADSIEEWADGAATAFGQSKTEAINFAASFGNAFKNVGFALDEATDKSKELTHLAADLGSAFNKSSADAALALRSGLLGESEPLRAFGVFLDEAKVKAKAASLGIAKLGDTLTDGQKVTARYALIMEQTADSQGMFGRDSESLADTQKMLQAEMENISATIGTELLPIMVSFVKFVRDEAVPVLKELTAAFGALDVIQGDEIETVEEGLDLREDLLGLLGNLSAILPEDAKAWLANEAAMDAATRATLEQSKATKAVSKDVSLAADIIGGSTDDIGEGYKEMGIISDNTRRGVVGDAARMRDAVKDFRDTLINAARDTITTAYKIISDKAELAAINVEKAELRKTIATGKATAEQKADYDDLTQRQAELILDLAENGADNQKVVKDAIKQIEKDLKTATGNRKKALQALLATMKALEAQAKRTSKAVSNVNWGGGGQGGGGSGLAPRAAGGPVTAGKTYQVNEMGQELFTPYANGTISTASRTAQLIGSGAVSAAGDTHLHLQTYGLPMVARTPVEVGYEVRRAIRHGRPVAPPKRATWSR